MKVLIDIKNCRECPYSWGGDMHNPHESWVCSLLADNVGSGEDVHEDCPLRESAVDYDEMTARCLKPINSLGKPVNEQKGVE